MDWTQTWTIIAAVVGLLTLQSIWIGRMFDQIGQRFDRMGQRFDRVDHRLDRIENTVLQDHGERIARLESRT